MEDSAWQLCWGPSDPTLPVQHTYRGMSFYTRMTRLSKLKNRKACGPDGIYKEHIKSSTEVLLSALTDLINDCLRTGNIPTTWTN